MPGLIRRVQNLLSGEEDEMSIADVAKGVELAVKDGGIARDDFKSLVQGAVLDGIREPHPDHPDRGSLRAEFIDLIREATAVSPPAG